MKNLNLILFTGVIVIGMFFTLVSVIASSIMEKSIEYREFSIKNNQKYRLYKASKEVNGRIVFYGSNEILSNIKNDKYIPVENEEELFFFIQNVDGLYGSNRIIKFKDRDQRVNYPIFDFPKYEYDWNSRGDTLKKFDGYKFSNWNEYWSLAKKE